MLWHVFRGSPWKINGVKCVCLFTCVHVYVCLVKGVVLMSRQRQRERQKDREAPVERGLDWSSLRPSLYCGRDPNPIYLQCFFFFYLSIWIRCVRNSFEHCLFHVFSWLLLKILIRTQAVKKSSQALRSDFKLGYWCGLYITLFKCRLCIDFLLNCEVLFLCTASTNSCTNNVLRATYAENLLKNKFSRRLRNCRSSEVPLFSAWSKNST